MSYLKLLVSFSGGLGSEHARSPSVLNKKESKYEMFFNLEKQSLTLCSLDPVFLELDTRRAQDLAPLANGKGYLSLV